MKTFVVEPRDPLMFRDARPFDTKAGRAASLGFPWPSTVAGFIRTQCGMNARGTFELTPDEARTIAVRGPWLVQLDEMGRPVESLVPAPRDCVFFRGAGKVTARHALIPRNWRPGTLSDLLDRTQLSPLQLERAPADAGKPIPAPQFWRWKEMLQWLKKPAAYTEILDLDAIGLAALPHELRTHVAVDADTRTAEDGKLFVTDGLRFTRAGDNGIVRYALACESDLGGRSADRMQRVGTLGGERRTVHVGLTNQARLACPEWKESDISDRRCRIVLLSPAPLKAGSLPSSDLLPPNARLLAACVGRPESVSGWDMAARGPKASRRMAPAGSVYWLEWAEGTDAAEIANWMRTSWLASICDDEQDRRDGFGLILTGAA